MDVTNSSTIGGSLQISTDVIAKIAKLATLDTKLEIVWVIADEEACHQRMIARNSSRDYWKLEHWDEYIKTRDFSTPAIEGLHTVNNSTDTSYIEDLNRLIEDMKNS